jgi:hypothetical protein
MRLLLTVCFLGTVDASSIAGERHPAESGDEGPGSEECQVDPEGQGKGQTDSDAGVIKRCNGVLIPPPTGDAEIIEPAPDVGTTPVIPPDSVPEQSPNSDRP